MKTYKLLVVTLLAIACSKCGDSSTKDSDLFSLQIAPSKKGYKTSESLSVTLNNKKNKAVDSVVYYLDNDRFMPANSKGATTVSLSEVKLGVRTLQAKIYSDGEHFAAAENITVLASEKPELYTYKIIETYPHDMDSYTQGLEFENNTLYESAGLRKKSSLRKTNYKTGEVLQKVPLADEYFGEGLTILNDKIYQLTYKRKTGFIYDLKTLDKIGTFVYGNSLEGWGLCNDGTTIYKSDGTEKIWTLNPETLAEEDYIEIYTNTSRIKSVNELEWIDGKIYANIYQQDAVAIVNPKNGAVEGVINFKGLKDKVTQHDALDVLNGIAYNGEPNTLYITGKNWDKLFKVEVVKK
ncbi:glutaminyl-peptide cyclotransferase [Cochleicola gelatinilyticus]|uniref:Glutamine cyclotransferase n=1 Tax=Cochleicola gelatinilyticus TaxID=1763537 RepID=A0A167HFN8_9FLAO|nr:glutaminyl-peptide cyclotransferase [Cochleicola gelatinilyticus]OAB78557.1 glutamine cyclotransferase [Cochleicola gelatinilyticus]